MDRPEITVQLRGGLGNQMFGAAAGIALTHRLEGRLRFDLGALQGDQKRTFALDGFNIKAEHVTLPTKSKSRISWPGLGRTRPQFWREQHFNYDPTFMEITGDAHISGYLQSPRYFADAEPSIRTAFDLAPLTTQRGVEIADSIRQANNQAVVLHVRHGDYISDPKAARNHGALSANYYRRALDLIRRFVPDPKVYLITDAPASATTMLADIGELTVAQGTTDYDDMFLISQCHHKIIANSSFSWWGAWLGSNKEGLTIAPKQWFSREKLVSTPTFDLYPDQWILL